MLTTSAPSAENVELLSLIQSESDRTNMFYVVQAMKTQESTNYKPSHYLEGVNVTTQDRMELCQWGYNVMDVCKVDRNIATVAISYFDRYLSCRGLRSVETCLANEREFQLAFVVSLPFIKDRLFGWLARSFLPVPTLTLIPRFSP